MLVSGSPHMSRRTNGYLTGGGSSDPFSAPKMSTLTMSRSKGWPTSKLWLASCTAENGWLVGHSTLPGCVGVKGLPSPKGLPRSLDLQSCMMEGDGGTANGPPEVCHLIWNVPRVALYSSTRAPQMSHPST